MKDLLLLVGLAVCVVAAHFLPLLPLGIILWLASAIMLARRVAQLFKKPQNKQNDNKS